MPFTRVGPNDYVSPSGRHYTKKQVALYYAHGESFPKTKRKRRARKKPVRKKKR